MATLDQFMNTLSGYMDEESLYEVYDLLQSGQQLEGEKGVPLELIKSLQGMGVPQELIGNAVAVAKETAKTRSSQLTKDAQNLASGNTGEQWRETPRITDQNIRDMAATSIASPVAGGMAADDPNNPYANIDWNALNAGVDQQVLADQERQREAEAAAAEQKRLAGLDSQYGHDLAWLDQLFQQDPAEAIRQAQAMGTAADPEVVKQQQALVDDVRSRGLTADQKSRDAQQSVVDGLGSIYDQGGTTARDRLLRAQARAESENWLKGQREADMQDLAERGMSGGGAELLTLLGDRQDAASRLSMADLQASADAEQRALDALMGKGSMAANMEGTANQYTQGNDALAGNLLGGMRSQGDAYQQGNADIISKVGQANKDFLRDAYQQTMDRRDAWNKNVMNQQIDMSKFMADLDARENAAGWGFGYDTANRDTGSMNDARTGFNNSTQGAFTGQTGAVRGAGSQLTGYTGAPQAHAGQAFSGAANFVGNLFSGLYGGGGGGNQQTEMKDQK